MTFDHSQSDTEQVASPQPFYLSGSAGSLFCLLQEPAEGVPRGGLVYLPPFAEEANRARRMAVLQARRLAANGWAVLLLDPFGTGDSAGAFHEARWGIWQQDTLCAVDCLITRWPGLPVTLWGMRLGALLAANVAAEAPERFGRLLFWQPVLRGDHFMSQFFRLRIAAAMAAGTKESGQTLRAQLAAGEILEVAGYELAPELVTAIEALSLEALLPALDESRIDWLEVSSLGGEPALAPASNRLLETFSPGTAPTLNTAAAAGEPFWTIQEFTIAPRLLEATDALFR